MIKPKVAYRSYMNRASQGSLIRQTRKWPKDLTTMQVGSYYIDRMESWDQKRFSEMVVLMGGKPTQQCGIDCLVETCTDDTLLKAASHYFQKPIMAVRWVYFYNEATGYPCERIDIIYTEEKLT